MCSGVQNAAPETHSTIIATFLVPAGTGPVQVTPVASTAVASRSTLASGSISTPTSGSILTSTPPSITPAVATSSTISLGNTATSTMSSPWAASTGTGTGPTLNTAQIAGISIGIAATLAFAIGLIFLAKCVRKRNFGDQESVLFKPRRESKGFGVLKSNQNSPRALHISAPIHKIPVDMEFRRPGDFQKQKPVSIGLALSPPRSVYPAGSAQNVRAASPKSLKQPDMIFSPYTPGAQGPPKPALTLTIPQDPRHSQKEAHILQSSRDSVMTEFQEDGEGESMRGSNIWRPPPTDPQSTTTYYVADKRGNWVLSSENRDSTVAELPSPLSRTKAERAMDAVLASPEKKIHTASGPPRLTPGSATLKTSAGKLGPAIEFRDRGHAPTSSGVYSDRTLLQSVAPDPGNPWPSKLPPPDGTLVRQISAARTKPEEPSKRKQLNRGSRSNKRRSQDSATTIASSIAEGVENEDAAGDDNVQESLSPVMESPRTPITPGRSPVSYPKLPTAGQEAAEHRRQQERKQLPTPPKPLKPALTLFPRPPRNSLLHPPPHNPAGQPGPSLGAVSLSPLGLQRKPAPTEGPGTAKQQLPRIPALNPNPLRNPADLKTGSPEMRTGSAASEVERQWRPSPPHQHERHQYQSHHRRGSSLELQQQHPHSRPVHGQKGYGASGLPDRILISPASATTSGSVDSTGSSFLLTKRLGADRAAALILGEDLGGQPAGSVKWQREEGGPGFVGHDRTEVLPATPGWLPTLTPTRRGDDLFLNVQ